MSDEFELTAARRRKRRGKRPRIILGIWARLGLSVAMIAVLVFFAICLVAKAVKPYREARLQSNQLAQTRQQSDQLEAQNVALQRQIVYLNTPGGVETSARRLGYLHPGEYPIVVEGLGHPGASDSFSEIAIPPAAPDPESRVRRLWQYLTGH